MWLGFGFSAPECSGETHRMDLSDGARGKASSAAASNSSAASPSPAPSLRELCSRPMALYTSSGIAPMSSSVNSMGTPPSDVTCAVIAHALAAHVHIHGGVATRHVHVTLPMRSSRTHVAYWGIVPSFGQDLLLPDCITNDRR